MRKILRRFTPATLVLLLCSALAAQTTPQATTPPATPAPAVPANANLKDPETLLSLAAKANGLDDPSLTPWHLKANYETFDDGGQSTGQGIFEEWWVAHDTWKRSYTGAHFSQVEYKTPTAHWFETAAGPVPWPESLIEQALVNPMPGKEETDDAVAEMHEQKFGDSKLSCVMLSQPYKNVHWPLGLFPTYCFNEASMMLRFGLFDGSIQMVMNQMATFEGRYFSEEIALSDNGKPLLRIHVQALRGMPEGDLTIPAPPPNAVNANPQAISVEPGVIHGNKLHGQNPGYPVEARQRGIQGKVVLKATIGTDGRIHRIRVLESPDTALTLPSIAAVERWIYSPYLLNGSPVSVETTIDVTFKTGRFTIERFP